eukprot:15338338-Ditylum_brightwellii.AAC.1
MTQELTEYAGRPCNSAGDTLLAIMKQKNVKFKLPTLEPEFLKEDKKEITDILIQKEYDVFIKCKATYIERAKQECMPLHVGSAARLQGPSFTFSEMPKTKTGTVYTILR